MELKYKLDRRMIVSSETGGGTKYELKLVKVAIFTNKMGRSYVQITKVVGRSSKNGVGRGANRNKLDGGVTRN